MAPAEQKDLILRKIVAHSIICATIFQFYIERNMQYNVVVDSMECFASRSSPLLLQESEKM